MLKVGSLPKEWIKLSKAMQIILQVVKDSTTKIIDLVRFVLGTEVAAEPVWHLFDPLAVRRGQSLWAGMASPSLGKNHQHILQITNCKLSKIHLNTHELGLTWSCYGCYVSSVASSTSLAPEIDSKKVHPSPEWKSLWISLKYLSSGCTLNSHRTKLFHWLHIKCLSINQSTLQAVI